MSVINFESPVFNKTKTSFIQNHIISSIINHKNLMCVGPTRSGKTSACILAGIQLIKDENLDVVFISENSKKTQELLESLKKNVEINFETNDRFIIKPLDYISDDLKDKVVIIDVFKKNTIEKTIQAIASKCCNRIVLASNEKIAIPKIFTMDKSSVVEIKSISKPRSKDRFKEEHDGRSSVKKTDEPLGARTEYKGSLENLKRGGKYVSSKLPGFVREKPYITTKSSDANLSSKGKDSKVNILKDRAKKDAFRRSTTQIIVDQKCIKEEFIKHINNTNLKKTWRISDPIETLAIYAGLRNTINEIESVMKSMNLKYCIFDKKSKDKENHGHNIFVIPEGSKKPANRKFDLVINYAFPETFEEYVNRIDNAKKAVSFVGTIDEGFKRSLCKLLEECGQKIPAMIKVKDSLIDDFDAFHIESDKEDFSDSDLWS